MKNRIVFDNYIKIIDGAEENSFNIIKAIKTLYHKDYICPFCSHGETIQLKVLYHHKDPISGGYRKVYLECSGCMSYCISETIEKYFKLSDEDLIEKSINIFEKLIIFSKNRTEFIL